MRIVLTGASGQLGAYVLERLISGGHEVTAWSGSERGERAGCSLRPVDVADASAVKAALAEADPDAIIHAGAISSADVVRKEPDRGRVVNTEGTARLAEWCAERGRRIVFTSTDLVFAGLKAWNREGDPAEPTLSYGKTKLAAEPAILAAPRGLVTRISLMFGLSRSGRESYFDRTIAALRRGEPQSLFEDEYRTPLDLATAADILVRLTESENSGLVHVGGLERVSRFELIRRVTAALGIDPTLVRANRQRDFSFPEPRPADVSLDSTRIMEWLPDLRRPTIEQAVANPFSS